MKPAAQATSESTVYDLVSPMAKFPSLNRIGVAVEYFPKYIHTRKWLHMLDVVLLSFTVGGVGKHLMDDEEYVEVPGSFSITHYGQAHDILTSPEGIQIFNVYLDLRSHPLPLLPPRMREVLAIILPLHPHFCHQLNRRLHLRLDEVQPVAHLLERMIHEQELQDEASDEVIRSLLGVLLVELCRAAMQHGFVPALSAKEEAIKWLENLRQYLDADYRLPHTLQDLSARTSVNPSYLCRCFKRYTGTTLMEYLNMRRIQAAMIGLRSTREKVIQIALESGFNDLAYFNRKFKALTGETPTQYRAKAK